MRTPPRASDRVKISTPLNPPLTPVVFLWVLEHHQTFDSEVRTNITPLVLLKKRLESSGSSLGRYLLVADHPNLCKGTPECLLPSAPLSSADSPQVGVDVQTLHAFIAQHQPSPEEFIGPQQPQFNDSHRLTTDEPQRISAAALESLDVNRPGYELTHSS